MAQRLSPVNRRHNRFMKVPRIRPAALASASGRGGGQGRGGGGGGARLQRLQRRPYERVPAGPRPGQSDGEAPLLAPELRWVLDTAGPQPLQCLKSGKVRVSEPYRTIEHVRQMNFEALPAFITSSRDERVRWFLVPLLSLINCFSVSTSAAISSARSQLQVRGLDLVADGGDVAGLLHALEPYASANRLVVLVSRRCPFEEVRFGQPLTFIRSLAFSFFRPSRYTLMSRKASSLLMRRRNDVWGIDSYPNLIPSRSRYFSFSSLQNLAGF